MKEIKATAPTREEYWQAIVEREELKSGLARAMIHIAKLAIKIEQLENKTND